MKYMVVGGVSERVLVFLVSMMSSSLLKLLTPCCLLPGCGGVCSKLGAWCWFGSSIGHYAQSKRWVLTTELRREQLNPGLNGVVCNK